MTQKFEQPGSARKGPVAPPQMVDGEPRYDEDTLRRATALAQRLQSQSRDTYTAGEIERIGSEVGLDDRFIREALARLMRPVTLRETRTADAHTLLTYSRAWWAAGWAFPFAMTFVGGSADAGPGFMFFLGWAVYIAGGILLKGKATAALQKGEEARRQALLPSPVAGNLSRQELLDLFFNLRGQLEGEKQHRAFLSVDVVGSSQLKHAGSELEVEYSFGQFHRWLEEIVRRCGGMVHSSAGDGFMAVFKEDQHAVAAARLLQEGMAGFNAHLNRLSQPFSIRCGLSSGPVAMSETARVGEVHSRIIDRAAILQKSADAGDILVGQEMAGAALAELGGLAVASEPVLGEKVFSWRSGRPAL